ncbi:hypothetical protein D3C78_863060 [compost metagenome]
MLLKVTNTIAVSEPLGRQVMRMAQRSGATNDFTEQPAGTHHAGAAEGNVRSRNQSACQEQIIQRAAIQRAKRDGVRAFAVKLSAAVVGAVNTVRRVQVNRPAAVRNRIIVIALLDDVLLAKNMIANKTAAFSFSGDGTDPLNRQIFCIRELAGVFNIIPDAPDDFPQFPFDLLTLVDGIKTSSPLQPPQIAAVKRRGQTFIAGDLCDVFERKRGGNKVHRLGGTFGVEIDGVAKLMPEVIAGSHFLTQFINLFCPFAILRTSQKTEYPITRRIAELRGAYLVKGFVDGIKCADGSDARAGFLHIINGGVQQQRQPWLASRKIKQNQVEHHRIPLFIAPEILLKDLPHDATLACPAIIIAHVRRRAIGPEAHFTGGISSQYRSVLNQDNIQAIACGRQGCTQSGKSTACDQQIGFKLRDGKGSGIIWGIDFHDLVSF